MYNSKRILYWNCQGIGQKHFEQLQLKTKLQNIYVILLNETHLNSSKIYCTDRLTIGHSNSKGTAILVRRVFTHTPITIIVNSIENTIIHLDFNGVELKLEALYKSPTSTLLTSDIDKLMDANFNIILADDLNAKNPAWHSYSTNPAGRTILNHMEQHDYFIIAPDTPTHYPDIHNHQPDIMDICFFKPVIYNLQSRI